MNMPFSHLLVGSILRGLELIPLMLLMGWQGFLALVLRSDTIASQGPDGCKAIVRFDRRVTIGALALILPVMVITFGHQSMMMSRRPLEELGPFVWPILTKTHFGNVIVGQAALWVCFAAVWSRRATSPASMARGRGVLLGLGALWCLTQSLSGHSADQGNWTADVLADWLHLLAVSFWAGGVVVLALLVPSLMKRGEPAEARALLIRVLERFSPVAMTCVAVLVAAGLFNAHKRGVALFSPFQSDYGGLVVFKVVLTAVAVGLGGFSKFVVLPALRRGAEGGSASSAGQFRRAIGVEAGVVLLVMLAAAVLTQTPPAGNVSLTSGPMTHPPMSHPPMSHPTIGPSPAKEAPPDHAEMNHAGMDHAPMEPSSMDHSMSESMRH